MIKVTKGGMQVLSNLTKTETDIIKDNLTLDNPVYKQVKQFSRFSYTRVPPYLQFYTTYEGSLIVPRGYEIPFPHKVVKDDRVLSPTLYPKFKLELRETQRLAYEAWDKNREKGMIVLPTGKGKSILGCYLAYATKQRALVIVQKDDLIDGWQDDFALCFGLKKGQKIGLIKAGKFHIGSQITLATIQTLNKLPEEKLRELYNKFGMIICDEVHHSPARSYEMFKYFQAKYFIGLTATDNRAELREVQYWMFGQVCFRCKESADDEDIMPYTAIVRESRLKYDPPQQYYYGNKIVDEDEAEHLRDIGKGKKLRRKPLDPQELKALLKDKNFNRLVAKDIVTEYRAKKSCIAFLHEKEHIRMLRDILVASGVPESHIQLYYGDNNEKSEVLKRRAETKEVLITIATFAKATEGTNVKAWERGFLVTSLNDEKNVEQAVGRCRRRKKGKPDVKIYTYSHPNVKGMRNHIKTQLKVFKKNKAVILGNRPNKGTVQRGWKR
jgi:superfamily II DNA or RNA helicase